MSIKTALSQSTIRLFIYVALVALSIFFVIHPIALFAGITLCLTSISLLFIVRLYGFRESFFASIIVNVTAVAIGVIDLQMAVIHIAAITYISWRMVSKPNGLIQHTLLFWLLAGGPLMAVYYQIADGNISKISTFDIQKEVVTALLGSLLVDVLFTYNPIKYISKSDSHKSKGFHFSRIMVHTSLVAITIPYLIYVILAGCNLEKGIKDLTKSRFTSQWQAIESYINNKTSVDLFELKKQGIIQVSRLSNELNVISEETDAEIVIVDQKNIVLGTNVSIPMGKPFVWNIGGSIASRFGDIVYWLPDMDFDNELEKWSYGYVIMEKDLPSTQLKTVIMIPFAPFLSNMLSSYTSQLLVYLLFYLSIILLSFLFDFFFFRPLAKLAETTTGIPMRLTDGNRIEWRKSNIVEIDMLTDNFKTVTNDLEEMFYHTHRLAYFDSLTCLPNRLSMQDALYVLFKKGSEEQFFALMFFDLDRFKQVNDSLGHCIGDKLLQVIAQRLKTIETKFIKVYRISGDEFVVIAEKADRNLSEDIAQHILALICQPIWIGQHELHITASIGIALYPEHGDNAETLMRLADASMYIAKEEGRNTYILYTESLQAKIAEQVWIEQQLRKALDCNQFTLHYQAIVDGVTSQLNGLEVLVRWNHPERGLVSPTQFIPVAEQSGLIVPIGQWVIRQACLQNKKWQDTGLGKVRIAVNISARQFYNGHIAEDIRRILKETGLEPQYLELEITEGFMIKDPFYVNTVLRELKSMGITVSIDDFGTGYSSLVQLKYFSVNTVKIDKSFVRNVETDKNNGSIVKAVIELAHGMNMRVVAEGVETEEERIFLMQHHCDEMQGYYFEKPIEAERFSQVWQKRINNSEFLEKSRV